MKERIVPNNHPRLCDLCGQMIQLGEMHRITQPDYGGGLWRHEHLRCPSAPAVATGGSPRQPLITKQHAFVPA